MGNVGFGQDRPFQDDNGGEDAIDDVNYHPRHEDALFSGGFTRCRIRRFFRGLVVIIASPKTVRDAFRD